MKKEIDWKGQALKSRKERARLRDEWYSRGQIVEALKKEVTALKKQNKIMLNQIIKLANKLTE